MALVLKTAPATEPISLAEAKGHLRIDSTDFADDIVTAITIAPGDHVIAAAYSLAGEAVEVSGYDVLVNLISGTNGSGGKVDVKLQESNDGETWSDVADGAFTQVTEANDNAVQEKEYTGAYTYLRAVATVAGATCDFGVTVIKQAGPAVEDDLISRIIKAARLDCERFQNRAYITQTWDLWLNAFPVKDYIELPLPPLLQPVVTAGDFVTGTVYRILSVESTDFTAIGAASNTVGVIFKATGAGSGAGTATASCIIKYYDTDDTEYFLDGSYYSVDDKDQYAPKVYLRYGQSWPSTTLRPYNGVCITFTCGYGDASAVPENLIEAMMLLIGHYYENREAVITGQPAAELPLGVERLLWKERVL